MAIQHARVRQPSPVIRIRSARASDVPALMPLMHAFNQFEGIAWRPHAMARALRKLLRERALGMVLVAEHAGQPIAYAIATFNYDLEFLGRDAFVTELFVHAEHRGYGVARKLLDALLLRLRRAGVHAAHLVVRPKNRAARALYERTGFELIPRLVMTKLLPAPRTRSFRGS